MIYLRSKEDIYTKRAILLWAGSAFKAGYINSAGFLVSGQFVSHVTGFGTRMGIAIGHKEYFFGLELLVIPVAFILGGVITSLILDTHYDKTKRPPFHWVQGLITFLIFLVVLLGESKQVKSTVQHDANMEYNLIEFSMLTLLCLICGLKNSLITWTTSGKIRVTHLTGISTDIGLNLIRTFGYKQPSAPYHEPYYVNLVRILIFVSFSTGAGLCAAIFPLIGYKSFLVILSISSIMTFISLLDWKKEILHEKV